MRSEVALDEQPKLFFRVEHPDREGVVTEQPSGDRRPVLQHHTVEAVLRLDVGLYPTRSAPELLTLGAHAESLGFHRIWVADSPMIWRELWVTLGALAMRTREIRLGSAVMDVALRDGFAYVMTAGVDWIGPEDHLGRRGPHIVDVRDPANPVRIWSDEPDPFRYQWVKVHLYSNANGNLAIVKRENHRLYTLEISDPFNPVTYTGLNWRLEDDEGDLVSPRDSVIQGDIMYVAALGVSQKPASFHIYNLSEIDPDIRPISPPRIATLQFDQSGRETLKHIAVDGDRAYVTVYDAADRTNRVVAIDVSDPSEPVAKPEPATLLKRHALGKFRDLLLATAKSPAMLFYLDNWLSVSPNAAALARLGANARRRGINENYARELMELHTLGVDGGYTQKDIIEVARCFTGWTIRSPQGGGFVYNDRTHDKGEKIVLGVTIPAGGGKEDGEKVLDIVARHPSTAKFISRKLAIRFVADQPPLHRQ